MRLAGLVAGASLVATSAWDLQAEFAKIVEAKSAEYDCEFSYSFKGKVDATYSSASQPSVFALIDVWAMVLIALLSRPEKGGGAFS